MIQYNAYDMYGMYWEGGDLFMTIRKNITLKQEDYDLISNFILKKGDTIVVLIDGNANQESAPEMKVVTL